MSVFLRNSEKNSDSDLLKEYLDTGNLEILGVLYNRYIHLVFGVCLKYLNNREESKDAVNRIFELLITEIPKYKIENFRSWLYVVTKNHCLMFLRKNKTERKHFENFAENFMESTEILHPVDESPKGELEKELQSCIEKLKSEQQQCIRLFYYENKCYKEIASFLGLNENKVKSYIQNGKRNLKICLEKSTEK